MIIIFMCFDHYTDNDKFWVCFFRSKSVIFSQLFQHFGVLAFFFSLHGLEYFKISYSPKQGYQFRSKFTSIIKDRHNSLPCLLLHYSSWPWAIFSEIILFTYFPLIVAKDYEYPCDL